LSGAKNLTLGLRSQLIGEAKFVRAFCYFYLVNLFGDVPLVTSTSYTVNTGLGRTSVNEIYQQIIQDLKEAQEMLSTSYPTPGKVRPNKWAATALLARAYLYMGNWADAEAQATAIIDA
jgi:hypothetical protein